MIYLFLPHPEFKFNEFKLLGSLSGQCHSFPSPVAPTNRVAWYLMAIYSSVYSPVRPVTDQEMKSRSFRLDGVNCPCSAHRSLLPKSRLWGSSCRSCFMDLSKMPCLGDASVLFPWKQAPGDASPFRSGHKYLLPNTWSHGWLCCSTFHSAVISILWCFLCRERETRRREVKPGLDTAGSP